MSYPIKKRIRFRGLDISVENPKGSVRHWYDPFGKESGSTKILADYGYIRGTKGTDGDHVDVYVGPEDSDTAFVIDQMKKPDFKTFDEQKVMLGFKDAKSAKALYLKQYDDPRFFGGMRPMALEEFKAHVLNKENHGEKVADDEVPAPSDRLRAGVGAAGLGLAAVPVAEHGLERAVGAQRFLHGTSTAAGKAILQEGLRPDLGGASHGSSAGIGSKKFVETSKGRVHVATHDPLGRMVAGAHAGLSDAQMSARKAKVPLTQQQAARSYMRGMLPGGGGRIVGGAMPYTEFLQKFEQDPDHVRGHAFRSTHAVPATKLTEGGSGVRAILKGRATNIGEYVAQHPRRFAAGLGLLGAAGGLATGAAYLGHRALAPTSAAEKVAAPQELKDQRVDMKKVSAAVDTFVTLGLASAAPSLGWEAEKTAVSAGWIREHVARGAIQRGAELGKAEGKGVARAAVDYAKNKLPDGPGLVSPKVLSDAKAARKKAIDTIHDVTKKRPFVNKAREAANAADAESFHRHAFQSPEAFQAATLAAPVLALPAAVVHQHREKRDEKRLSKLELTRDLLKEAESLPVPPPPGSPVGDYAMQAVPSAVSLGVLGLGANTGWQHARQAASQASEHELQRMRKSAPKVMEFAQRHGMFDPHRYSGKQLRNVGLAGAAAGTAVGAAGAAWERHKQQKKHEQGLALREEIAELKSRAKEAEADPVTARAEHIDDLGLTVLGLPAAASLAGHAMSHAPESWAKTRAAGKVLKEITDSVPSHAAEIAGLALVSPTISRRLAEATMPKEAGLAQVAGRVVGGLEHQAGRLRQAVTTGAESAAHGLHGAVTGAESGVARGAEALAGKLDKTVDRVIAAPGNMAQDFRAARSRAVEGLPAMPAGGFQVPPAPATHAVAHGAPEERTLRFAPDAAPGALSEAVGGAPAAAHAATPHAAPEVPSTAPGAVGPTPAANPKQMGTLRRAAPLLALGGVGALGAGGYAASRAGRAVHEAVAPDNTPLNIDRVAPTMGIPAY